MSNKESIQVSRSTIFYTREEMMQYIGKFAMRICTECGQTLFPNDFPKDKSEETGRSKVCRKCMKK